MAAALMTAGSTNWNAMSNATFVATLYQRSFGVPGTDPNSVNNLNLGLISRAHLMAWFSSVVAKNHWRNTVDASMLYYGMLDRAPDPSGLTFWRNQLNGGASYVGIVDGFRHGPEYENRIPNSVSC